MLRSAKVYETTAATPPQQRSLSADNNRRRRNKTLVPEGVAGLQKSWEKMNMKHRAVCAQVPDFHGNSRSIKSGVEDENRAHGVVTTYVVLRDNIMSINSGRIQSRDTKVRQSLESRTMQQSTMETIRSQMWSEDQPKSSSMKRDDGSKQSGRGTKRSSTEETSASSWMVLY